MIRNNLFYLCTALLVILATSHENYTLELDWYVSPNSDQISVGYVTWNQQTLITLTNNPAKKTDNHENIVINFNEGHNQLGIYFIGLSGNLIIDNIRLTKDSGLINFVLNGDFQMCNVVGQFFTFKNKIPGWNAPTILIGKSPHGNNQLILNNRSRTVTQTISYGKVSSYQFTDSINSAIQNQAKDIITANLLSISVNSAGSGVNIWNTPLNSGLNPNVNTNFTQLLKILSTAINSTLP